MIDSKTTVLWNTPDAEQPPPHTGDRIVGAIVLADIRERIELGRQRYGTYLRTHNGLDAEQDAYEELIDAVLYTKQGMLERADLAAEVERLQAQVLALSKLVCVMRDAIPALTALVDKRDAIVDAWAEANIAMLEK